MATIATIPVASSERAAQVESPLKRFVSDYCDSKVAIGAAIVMALFASIVVVALPWAAHRLVPAPLPIPAMIQTWGALLLALVGLAGWIHCAHVFATRARGTPSPIDPPRLLVTDGLYGVVRHPMEVSEMIVVWGVALYVTSLGTVLYAALLMVVFHLGVVLSEEPDLRQRFGESYDAYCQNVPRWWLRGYKHSARRVMAKRSRPGAVQGASSACRMGPQLAVCVNARGLVASKRSPSRSRPQRPAHETPLGLY